MLKAPYATFCRPKRMKGWAQNHLGKTESSKGQE